MLSGLLLVLGVWLAGMGAAHAQFTQHRDTIKIDPSAFPAEIQRGYRLFSMKCNECHGLDTSLKPSMSATQWAAEVKRMQAMPSSQFNDAQAKAILDFLNYDEAHRKSLNKSADQTAPSGNGGAGRQFYDAQGCATCHAIGGKGGTNGPSLSDVGKRLSKEQLTAVIQDMKAGKSSMPPLPPGTTDQQVKDLVDFLVTLGGETQKQNADQPTKPETPTDQKSKPTAEAVSPGIAGGGHQFYDTQGCATCHAIGGKGGTNGPSLSDVGKRLSKEQLTAVIQSMKTGKSSMPPLPPGTTDQQVKDLVDFLVTLGGETQKQNTANPKEPETPRDQTPKPAAATVASGTGPDGRQFYDTQGCAKCHAIGGKGGTNGPSLSGVGKRLSKDRLTAVIQSMKAGKSSMPPLPPGTTDQQVKEVVAFLVTLGDETQKEIAAKPKEPETPRDQTTKPAAETAASGTAPGGRQFYDAQGCAKCHAIGGKGGTNGPSLSDVGKRLSKDRLAAVIQGMRTGKSSMPPLPPGTTDQQAKTLVAFLVTLDGQKQTAASPKEPETRADQKSPPLSQSPVEANEIKIADAASHSANALPGILLLFLIAVTAVLLGVLVFRPGITSTQGGKILAFCGMFLLPLVCAGMGTTYHIDRSKSTQFCLSCHEMQPYGKSLLVDDRAHLPAAHFQFHRVPTDEACYTCHTNYAMFGGFRAKMGGLKHVYVHYLGKPPAPEAIRLYQPFNNRECLHCHLGARSFEEGATHTAKPYLLSAIKANAVSCLSSGCHQTVHGIAELNNAKFWKGNL